MEGFDHRRAAISSTRSPLAALPSIAARRPRLVREASRADLIHLHGDTAALLSLGLLRTPAVWTTHGLHLLRRSGRLRRPLLERGIGATVSRTACTLCTSAAEADELSAFVSARVRDRLVVAPNGVPLREAAAAERRVALRGELGLDEQTVAALFAGQLEPRKDPLAAVGAASIAAERGAPLALLVAGDGPLRGEVDAVRAPAVRALGYRDDVDDLLAASDIFVLPSVREGLSFALLEAMSHGLVPVVADAPGNVEAVGEAGVVVPAGDVGALAAVLERLARDKVERARLGAAARDRVRECFSADRLVAEVERAYRRALS